MVVVGVLALQGDFREHIWKLKELAIKGIEVRTSEELNSVDALIIPGGESTTIGKLIKRNGLGKVLENYNKPIWGTCAGAILLAKNVIGDHQYKLGLIDISIKRNDYGRQLDSFEKKIMLNLDSEQEIDGIFIRAPRIISAGKGVKILAKDQEDIIMAEQGNVLVTTFHPELSKGAVVHEYFIKKINQMTTTK